MMRESQPLRRRLRIVACRGSGAEQAENVLGSDDMTSRLMEGEDDFGFGGAEGPEVRFHVISTIVALLRAAKCQSSLYRTLALSGPKHYTDSPSSR
jgi:hypothetical protein